MNDAADQLAKMWRELLETEDVTEDSDFFECGGNSVTAVHLAALIHENLAVSVDAIDVVMLRTFGRVSGAVADRLAAG
ncbi:MAG TPA: phosphopantetheine-binding protein [Pseudonocardiaceae bacterium]|jgi:acyl carrier protein|nr:phosphopantetheine-binding protein [Pseudonocardiaceae bacterium]